MNLAFFCLEYGSWGDYTRAFTALHEGLTKAKERDNIYFLGRLMNSRGWLHSELGDVAHALEYDHESAEIGRSHGIPNVEISALINLGLNYLALDQIDRARSYLEPTLERVVREALGSHRWRWKIRLLLGLAELSYTTGAYEQALRYLEEGLSAAQATSSQKYIAKGWALQGKIAARLGDAAAAGAEFQRAFTLTERVESLPLLYPLAHELGQWYETTGQERTAAEVYRRAKAAIDAIATSIEETALRAIFLQSASVAAIEASLARLGR
jgi:tetratricopeptide (TPR) repeat protein